MIHDLKRKYEVDAAMLRLIPELLEKRGRGDEVTYADIESVGGIERERVAARIRTFYKKRGIHLITRAEHGWLLAEDEQQVGLCDKYKDREKRIAKIRLHAALNVDDAKLSSPVRAHRELHLRNAGSQLASFASLETEVKNTLNAPSARPQLVPHRAVTK